MLPDDSIKDGRKLEKNGCAFALSVDDLELHVCHRKDDEVEEDITCDSKFMEEIMPKVGKEMRAKYHWIPMTQKMFLGMDNAGGHGTEEAKMRHTEALKQCNIEITWQCPCSPETNMLDLGGWMSTQCSMMKDTEERDAMKMLLLTR